MCNTFDTYWHVHELEKPKYYKYYMFFYKKITFYETAINVQVHCALCMLIKIVSICELHKINCYHFMNIIEKKNFKSTNLILQCYFL